MINETKFSDKLRQELKKQHSIQCVKIAGSRFQRSMPDLYMHNNTHNGWIETKVDGRVITKQQEINLCNFPRSCVARYFNKSGAVFVLCFSLSDSGEICTTTKRCDDISKAAVLISFILEEGKFNV